MDIHNLQVQHIMTTEVITVVRSHSLPLADARMQDARIRHLPVVDDGNHLVGLVSQRDVLAAHISALTSLSEDERSDFELTIPVERIMKTEVWTVREHTPAADAVRMLRDHKFGCAPVVDGERRVVGIVTEADFLALFVALFEPRRSIAVADVATTDVVALRGSDALPKAERLMTGRRIRHLPVVDDDRRVVGLVTHRDLLAAQHSALTTGDAVTPSVLVREVARACPWTVTLEATAVEAAKTMLDNRFGCLPVVGRAAGDRAVVKGEGAGDGGALVGIVTEADILAVLGAYLTHHRQAPVLGDAPVNYYMSEPVRSIGPDEDLERAQQVMAEYGISSLAVVDGDGALIGVVSQTDLIAAAVARFGIGGRRRALVLPTRHVADVMSRDVASARPDEPIAVAARRMIDRKVHRLIVVTDGAAGGVADGAAGPRPVGVLATADVTLAVRDMRIATPVSALMTPTLFTVDVGVTVGEADAFLDQSGLHGVVVRDGAWPVGVFTQREALASRELSPDTGIEHVMSTRIICVPENMPLHRVAAQVAELGARRVLAIGDGQLTGILAGMDFARACSALADAPSTEPT